MKKRQGSIEHFNKAKEQNNLDNQGNRNAYGLLNFKNRNGC